MKKIKKVFSIIWYTIVGLISIVSCYIIVSRVVFKNPAPSMLGFYILNVETGSMVPTLSIGDLIIVRKVDVEDLEKDMIITYIDRAYDESGKSLTTHRISTLVYNNEGELVAVKTTGDFTKIEEDYEFSVDDVIGKYTGVRLKGFGIIRDIMGSATGIIIFICLIALAVMIPHWREFFPKRVSKDQDDRVEELEKELKELQGQLGNEEKQ